MSVEARRTLPPGLPSAAYLGDPYSELLERTRSLQQEQRAARADWLQSLPNESAADQLFELEVLLKASACFANPRNHPGPLQRIPVVAQDFARATILFRAGMQRASGLARQLLGDAERTFVFQRYLETVLPEDTARSRLWEQTIEQRSPRASLMALRHALTSNTEVLDGVLRGQRVPFRLYHAMLSSVQREVARNAYFNPLTALEFRPEFDRIHSGQILELIRGVAAGEAQRLAALTFLSLFRMLRYLELIERIAAEPGAGRHRLAGRAFLVLSVLRSDARALSDYLSRHAAVMLSDGFERELMEIPSARICSQSAELKSKARRLNAMKSALGAIAGNLRLELRRTFVHELPALGAGLDDAGLRARLHSTVASLRPALRNAILFFGKTLGASFEEGGVFDDRTAQRENSEQLRRDVWMFAQIVRAFATKAHHSKDEDRWGPVYNFHYVSEFLAYFRAMGYPLLRAADYPRVDAFMEAMGGLEEADLVDPARLARAVEECAVFHGFLQQLFDDISRREALRGTPFDRRAAAAALRLYLGDRAAERFEPGGI